MKSYHWVIKEILAIWLTLLSLFAIGRVYFFFDFLVPDFFKQADISETIYVFLMAARFDLSAASLLISPLFLLTLLLSLIQKDISAQMKGWCRYWKHFVIWLSIILMLTEHYFFYYYQDHFNIFFWEFWMEWENSILVFLSIMDELPLLQLLIAVVLFGVWGYGIHWFVSQNLPPLENIPLFRSSFCLILWSVFFLATARGTFGTPLSISIKLSISTQAELNRIHRNPFYSLYASWEKSIRRSADMRKKVAGQISNSPESFTLYANIDHARRVNTSHEQYLNLDYHVPLLGGNYLRQRPKHVVLIFMEGFGEWITLMEEHNLNQLVAGNFLKIKQQGIYFDNYFPAGSGTLQNLSKAILGIPTPVDMPAESDFTEGHKPFPGSLARILKQMGYFPQFYYGGNLTWHHLSLFLKNAGFEAIYGADHISTPEKTRFGVHDQDLFNLVHHNLKNAEQPTFSFIMTLSNHPPFEWPKHYKPPEGLKIPSHARFKLRKYNFEKRFGAFSYSDFSLGKFIENAKQSPYFSETLFMITADHSISGSFQWKKEDQYRVRKIPLLLYSPALLKQDSMVIHQRGSHLDLAPTLSSLLSASPLTIPSWGRSLLSPPSTDNHLYSFYLDCMENVCRHLENYYRVAQDKTLLACSDPLCRKKAKQIMAYREAFNTSGLHYFFRFQP
ncbi:MAG: LTA synthase family protein [SAR324 cluster bacterium]|nr:LTA synthase family protein [SAR324 cluster bacterium]